MLLQGTPVIERMITWLSWSSVTSDTLCILAASLKLPGSLASVEFALHPYYNLRAK